MVEHWTVAPVVAGSIPVIHPNPSTLAWDVLRLLPERAPQTRGRSCAVAERVFLGGG